jgi:hypothetical protein
MSFAAVNPVRHGPIFITARVLLNSCDSAQSIFTATRGPRGSGEMLNLTIGIAADSARQHRCGKLKRRPTRLVSWKDFVACAVQNIVLAGDTQPNRSGVAFEEALESSLPNKRLYGLAVVIMQGVQRQKSPNFRPCCVLSVLFS